MEGMAVECVEHILSFLPIADVFVCRSVCGKWKGVADSVIRRQKALKFFVLLNNRRTEKRDGIVLRPIVLPVQPDDETPLSLIDCWRTQPSGRNAGVWIKRLEGMVRLEKLAVVSQRVSFDSQVVAYLKSLVDAVIVRNESTLITIDMKCNSLPFEHKPELPVLVHGKLQNLSCGKLTFAAAAACPRLVHLRAGYVSAEVMQNLPHETMQYLHVNPDTQEPEEVEMFATAISRMTQLKDLKLNWKRFDTPVVNPDHLLTKLFSNVMQLEKIDIRFPYGMDGTVDAAIDRLVCNNPRLAQISFENANITGASLVSFSRLTGLRRLLLWHNRTNRPEFTTDNILTLLRGGSCGVLQCVKVSIRPRPDQVRIEAEVKIMERVMGCTFSVGIGSDLTWSWVIVTRGADR